MRGRQAIPTSLLGRSRFSRFLRGFWKIVKLDHLIPTTRYHVEVNDVLVEMEASGITLCPLGKVWTVDLMI